MWTIDVCGKHRRIYCISMHTTHNTYTKRYNIPSQSLSYTRRTDGFTFFRNVSASAIALWLLMVYAKGRFELAWPTTEGGWTRIGERGEVHLKICKCSPPLLPLVYCLSGGNKQTIWESESKSKRRWKIVQDVASLCSRPQKCLHPISFN